MVLAFLGGASPNKLGHAASGCFCGGSRYDWSVGRNGWEPLWDVERLGGKHKSGVSDIGQSMRPRKDT